MQDVTIPCTLQQDLHILKMPPPSGGRSPKLKDVGVQTQPIPEHRYTGKRLLWLGAGGLVAILLVPLLLDQCISILNVFGGGQSGFHVPQEIVEDMGLESILLFKRHDRDDDGFLSIEEFEPLAHQLKEVNVSVRIVLWITFVQNYNYV